VRERRTCSKLKPWIYFLLEMIIYISLSAVLFILISLFVNINVAVPAVLLFMGFIIIKTRSFQRLENILARTENVKWAKMLQKYGNQNDIPRNN